MSGCPSPENLAVYAAGASDTQSAAAIAGHVEECTCCREILQREQSNNHWLSEIRRAGADPTVAAGEHVVRTQVLDAQAPPPQSLAIKGYRILREIGGGGQAVIYLAIQESTGQEVAIKVPREGRYITRSERRRFEREIELVTQLKHPNIISIFDSGRTSDGRKYYVMDYVCGQTLSQYVRERELPLEEALELFAALCDAVQFAHQRGIIHRDLKPSNVLVDAAGNPKVLDFGLARSSAVAAQHTVSVTRELLGTLPYISPEQVSGGPSEVDIRTDVYALGVILYELLTGAYPYAVTGSVVEVLRTIVEAEPRAPSRQWTSSAGIRARSQRRVRADSCPIDSELETIVLHALAKDRSRRYQTARDLAADIRHYLANEPIDAKRDSGWYMFRKTLARYRVPVSVTAAFIVLLLTTLGVVTAAWRLAVDQSAWSACMAQLARTEDATVRELSDNLDRLADFRAAHPYSMQRAAAQQRRAAELQALAARLETALRTNRLEPWLEAFAGQPQALPARLAEIPGEAPTRFCRRLAQWLAAPLSTGRGQELLDCARLLESACTSSREAADDFRRRLRERRERNQVVYEVNFAECAPGQLLPPGWDGQSAARIGDGLARGLHVWSNTNDALGAHYMGAFFGEIVVLSTSVRFVSPTVPSAQRDPHGSIALRFANDGSCVCRFERNHDDAQSRNTSPYFVAFDQPRLQSSDKHRIELWYSAKHASCDILVDDALLLEDITCDAGGPVTEIVLSAGGGAEVVYDDVVLRTGQVPLKAPATPFPPIITKAVSDVSLRLVRYLDHSSTTLATRRATSTNPAALITGDYDRADGALRFFEWHGALSAEPAITDVNVTGMKVVHPRAYVDGLLSVWGEWKADARLERGFKLIDIRRDGTVAVAFQRSYENLEYSQGLTAPVRSAGGSAGFVVGTRHGSRCFELFAKNPPGAEVPYTGLGPRAAIWPAAEKASDIVSLLVLDRDRDGTDDALCLGLGPLDDGYRPALVTGEPLLGRPKADYRVWPITLPIGTTYVAVSALDTESLHVIAASGDRAPSGHWAETFGVRVWRLADLLQSAVPAPVYCSERPEDARAIAAGTVNGRDVVAVAFDEYLQEPDCRNLMLRLYAQEAGRIVVPWEARLFDVDQMGIAELVFVDLDADEQDELVVGLHRGGVLIFSASNHERKVVPDARTSGAQLKKG